MKPHVLATKINSILHDNKFDRFVGNKTRGKLDFSALSKIGYSPKVFKKREARKNKDYKVIVLADASGSMYSRDKYLECGNALTLIADSLEQTDVEYCIWSFAGDVVSIKDFKEPKPSSVKDLYIQNFHRRMLHLCYSCHTAFGTFNSTEPTCLECGVALDDEDDDKYEVNYEVNESNWYNVDGLALHLALEHIKKESGKHIVVILSDGKADDTPDLSFHYLNKDGPTYEQFPLRKVVERAKKEDVILCSIGILDDNVNKFYPKENTIVLKESGKLGEALVSLIKKQITRG